MTGLVDSGMFTRRSALTRVASGVAIGSPGAGVRWLASVVVGSSSCSATGGQVINLANFGVSPTASPEQNLAAMNHAVAVAPSGAILYLPPTAPLVCLIDTSGGWSRAVQIDHPLSIWLDGDIKATHSQLRPDPPFILNITAPGVRLTGKGRIIGDGQIDDRNRGTDETFPGLVRVAADDFEMSGVEMVAPPKVGLMLYHCRRAVITGARFSGGPKIYGDTGHFAIRAAGGGEHRFEGNRFYPATDGGMAVQCIMLSSSHDNLFAANYALHPFEKLIYGYGDRNLARDNIVEGNPGFILGTNVQGTYTAVIRFHGSSNRVENNRTTNCAGGVQMMDGAGHVVINNEFLSCGQSAITAYHGDLSGSVFARNIGTRSPLAGFVGGDGMRLVSDQTGARNVTVADNNISGFSVADPLGAIATWRDKEFYGRNSIIKPAVGNGRFYVATTAGSSASREPSWPSRLGDLVSDGSVVWAAAAYEGGQTEIRLSGKAEDAPIVDSEIRNNQTRGGRLGIVTQFLERSRIVGNRISASEWGLVEKNGRRNQWSSNVIQGTAERTVRILHSRNP